jgi:hypothetical protein
MSFLRKAFDRAVEHEYGWASTLFRLAFWWISASFALILIFLAIYRMKGLLSTIPPVIQAACLILVAMALLLMVAMFRERRRALENYGRFIAALRDIKPASEAERMSGLSEEKMAGIRRKAGLLTNRPREWWKNIEGSLERYTSLNGDEGWFLTRPLAEILPEEDVIDSFYHSSFHQAVPGILTALGLLATFVAILMALAGVSYNVRDPIRPVSGIDQLINGLSGKFLSSIIALILSVVFTLFEKKVCDLQVQNGYAAMIKRYGEVFPLLTQSRILIDIQRLAMLRSREAISPGQG